VSRAPNHQTRRRLLLVGLILASFVVVGRGFTLQVLATGRWSARAVDQQRKQVTLPAPRGTIYDRNGVPLAVSRISYRISVAPGELRDREETAQLLREVLGLSEREARRAVDPERRWVVIAGRHDAVAQQKLAGVRGLYFESIPERFYPHGAIGLELLGRVQDDGQGAGGVEQAYDAVLRGEPGLAIERRDARGEVIPGSLISVIESTAGNDLYLTIDLGLQEIAHEALNDAIRETGSEGGDLILVDRRSGEILAAVSQRRDGDILWRSVVEPFEPGSTLKPFFISALLETGKVALTDSVYAEEGRYTYGRRVVSDVSEYGWLSVGEALSVSSNVAMVKLSELLDPAEQYTVLRDFGFGTPTGVSYPAEAGGRLRRPQEWSAYSAGSLAIGYEVSVTPLQVVMAYGALANDGILMEPLLVREVRARDGRVIERNSPRVVRRVVSEGVAKSIGTALREVVEMGSGREASLGAFSVAGKTGTARRFVDGRYGDGHTASFAGFFPADEPQLAFLVKLDRPQGAYYGGAAAAPVTRATLAAALAARGTALDRRRVAQRSDQSRLAEVGFYPEERDLGEGGWLPPAPGPFIFALDAPPPERYRLEDRRPERLVPDLRGLPLRDAARRLHGLGLQVRVEGTGIVRRSVPAPGAQIEVGEIVILEAEWRR